MSDLSGEIQALRQEVAELRRELDDFRSQATPSASEPWQQLSQHLLQHLAQTGEARAMGVARQVVLQDSQERGGGWWARGHRTVWPRDGDLTSHAQDLIGMFTFWGSNPLAVRALSQLAEPYLQGQAMILPKAELATALGVSATELEEALRPLVANETLKWTKTATGEECYELLNSDTFLTLLALASKAH
jgi:hypothetical protein